jgi:predicted nucleic acid-binding protein
MEDKLLIDTSAWIEFFRKKDLGIYALVVKLLKEKRAVGSGVIAPELMIAHQAIENNPTLLTLDNHFKTIQKNSALRLYRALD